MNSRIPWTPSSRPWPEALTPPKGMRGSEATRSAAPRLALSFDVECYYQIVSKDFLGRAIAPTEEVARNTGWILDLLARQTNAAGEEPCLAELLARRLATTERDRVDRELVGARVAVIAAIDRQPLCRER